MNPFFGFVTWVWHLSLSLSPPRNALPGVVRTETAGVSPMSDHIIVRAETPQTTWHRLTAWNWVELSWDNKVISAAAFPLTLFSRRKSHNRAKREWAAHRLLIDALIDVIIIIFLHTEFMWGKFCAISASLLCWRTSLLTSVLLQVLFSSVNYM